MIWIKIRGLSCVTLWSAKQCWVYVSKKQNQQITTGVLSMLFNELEIQSDCLRLNQLYQKKGIINFIILVYIFALLYWDSRNIWDIILKRFELIIFSDKLENFLHDLKLEFEFPVHTVYNVRCRQCTIFYGIFFILLIFEGNKWTKSSCLVWRHICLFFFVFVSFTSFFGMVPYLVVFVSFTSFLGFKSIVSRSKSNSVSQNKMMSSWDSTVIKSFMTVFLRFSCFWMGNMGTLQKRYNVIPWHLCFI